MDLTPIIKQKLQDKFSGVSIEYTEYRGELTLQFDKQYIVDICRFLKEDPDLQYRFCDDITAVDWAKRKNRFTVVYHIFSLKSNHRLALKADVDESDCSIESVTSVWSTANWHERETYDMYGIIFKNHPDLRRMYMPEEFEYHPLRKDFPLMGIPGSLSLPKK